MRDEQLLRYAKHIMLPEVDVEGQEKLLASKVLIIGLGGLGSPVSMYLAASGIGSITLADHDSIDLSNLQRQIVHKAKSIGELKTKSAKRTLQEINLDTNIRTIDSKLTTDQLNAETDRADIVVDCTDNFQARYAINDACLRTKTRLVSGAATRFEGHLMVIDPTIPNMPCYRCLYDNAVDIELNCSATGIAAPVVGTVGTLQALETIKLILGIGESLAGYLLTWDAKYMDWRKLKLPKRADCSC